MNKIFLETIKDFINDSIEEATELKNTLLQIEAEENKERFEEIKNKFKEKSYTEKRAEEIMNECNINKALEGYYNLGLSTVYGHVMYMLDQDFDKKDIKKVIMDACKDDVQFRSDVFGVWGELYDRSN